MNDVHRRGDLFVLVADQDMLQAVNGLLLRPQSLKMTPIEFDVRRHPGRDSGCRVGAADYLRAFLRSYRFALVMFDLAGSGSRKSRVETQHEVEEKLNLKGWERRAKVIVIEPELEAWVWGMSQRIPEILGWSDEYGELRRWLHEQGLWPENCRKPPDPKEAMRRTMQQSRARKSPRKFFELASATTVKGCRDPSFGEFKQVLRSWFPPRADEHAQANYMC